MRVDGRTHGQSMTILIAVLRNFANATKNEVTNIDYITFSVVIPRYCSFLPNNFETGREDADHMSVCGTARDRNERPWTAASLRHGTVAILTGTAHGQDGPSDSAAKHTRLTTHTQMS
jgi:hypothetical protein